uniref:EF-hand domain-containing protein n=1 Tax=Chromera velia CCMP2878 TaxID=1169474 RepID=A0A0G4FGE1_9ALVE|eukprot:Cvel_16836.t1-p1 / transcript=Cvel_16836.t1 / gene=Cvel_16836 / organism=Chromera_velia_CCMP2878 / gene_product=hypothetical protein / transcript_product=hypothetical protein / location=Cvel_scaffold1316:17745-26608(+) / protein_length=455 / sequence_SO=supercontig / SO=protein_coding / is_pseudo=false
MRRDILDWNEYEPSPIEQDPVQDAFLSLREKVQRNFGGGLKGTLQDAWVRLAAEANALQAGKGSGQPDPSSMPCEIFARSIARCISPGYPLTTLTQVASSKFDSDADGVVTRTDFLRVIAPEVYGRNFVSGVEWTLTNAAAATDTAPTPHPQTAPTADTTPTLPQPGGTGTAKDQSQDRAHPLATELSRKSLKSLSTDFGIKPSDGDLAGALRALDANGDGLVDVHEWMVAVKGVYAARPPPPAVSPSHFSLGARKLKVLLSSLPSGPSSLQTLTCECDLDDSSIFFQSLPPSLEFLDLRENRLRRPSMESFSFVLAARWLPTLLSVDLSDNPLGPFGVRALAKGLCAPLQSLRLGRTDARKEGAEALAEVLKAKKVSSLQTLDLAENEMWAGGFKPLAAALSELGAVPSLRVLILKKNSLTHVNSEETQRDYAPLSALLSTDRLTELEELRPRG